MSVLDAMPLTPLQQPGGEHDEEHDAPETIDLRGELVHLDAARQHDGRNDSRAEPSALREPVRDSDRRAEGVRVRRIRVGSAAKVAAVFFTVGYLAVLGTLVTCWNVVQQLGFVSDLEELAITSLGLESFVIDGQQLFELSAIVTGGAFVLAFLITVLLALVFNATCALLGGVAVEFGPLRRTKRVFSPKHRRFISV